MNRTKGTTRFFDMTQDDIDLLTSAGLAIGLELDWGTAGFDTSPPPYRMDRASCSWNPLVANGDALQLAAQIGAEIKTYCVPTYVEDKPYVTVTVAHWVADTGELIRLELREEYTDDQMQAIRTAIVRMAVELGKKLTVSDN